jgi:DNA polymerase-3 subunit beta
VKFRCEKEVLAEALGAASRASTGRSTNPTMSCLRLVLAGDQLRITGTDGDLTIDASIIVAGSKDGVVLVPAKLVSDVVRSLQPGAVEFDLGEDNVEISANRVNFTVPIGAGDDFPKWSGTVGQGASMSAKDFSEALRQVVRSASTDDSRGVFTGVLLTGVAGKLRLVATDSYRMSVRDIITDVLADGTSVVVPARALGELQKLLGNAEKVSINITENDATFEIGSVRLVTRLLTGAFADYQRLIPANLPNKLVISREAMMEAIRRVKLVARDPIGTPLRLEIKEDSVTLRMVTPDNGEAVERLDAVVHGADIEIRFNNELLTQGLDASGADEITIQTSEPGKLALIRGVGQEDFTYLLMPLKS